MIKWAFHSDHGTTAGFDCLDPKQDEDIEAAVRNWGENFYNKQFKIENELGRVYIDLSRVWAISRDITPDTEVSDQNQPQAEAA